jgi:predicted metalloendopeptidase
MRKPFVAAGVAALALAVAAQGGVDPAAMDLAVKPQDDFFQYVNGTWLRNNPIPPEYATWGTTAMLRLQNAEALHAICEAAAAAGPKGTAVQRMVGDLYASGMDEAAADAAGDAPLQPELDRIAVARNPADVMEEIARLQDMGFPAGFSFGSGADAKDSATSIAQLRQGGLGLPDRDYYLIDDDRSKKTRAEYVEHMGKVFQLLGDPPGAAAAEAQAVLGLETALAQASLSKEVLRNPYASYHKLPVADLPKYTGVLDWVGFFHEAQAPAFDQVNFAQPEFFRGFAVQLTTAPVATWKSYLRWHLARAASPYLSRAFVDEDFHFNGEIMKGTKRNLERWKRVVAEVDGDLGEALGQLYVEQHFPPAAKARVLELVANLRAALREDIQGLPWMDAATKAKALEKLDAMGVKMGYPDTWRDYSAVKIDRGPYVLDVIRANAFERHRDLAKIGRPVDRAEWHMTPPTVNAYYSQNRNEVVFPAGFLQPPCFDPKADDAANYGAIGAIIGHEMTHGFDDKGRQYDAHGNLTDWWSPASADAFKAKAALIVAQFNGYEVLPGLHVNGELTQGENIADLGGLKIAYAALEKALEGRPRDKIDGFTPEQRFFLSYASNHRAAMRPEALRLLVNTDPHAPYQTRCNGPLSNMREFYAAFDIPEGAPMRRPAAEQVTIW